MQISTIECQKGYWAAKKISLEQPSSIYHFEGENPLKM